jgi:uncharacterized protein YwqG
MTGFTRRSLISGLATSAMVPTLGSAMLSLPARATADIRAYRGITSMSLPRTRDEFFALLNQTRLPAKIVTHLTAQARSAVLMMSVATPAVIAIGMSRLGGTPDLPTGMAWPIRPAYPDAAARAELHRKQAADYRAEAEKPNTWLKPDDAERFALERLALADVVTKPFPLGFLGQFDLAELAKEKGFDTAFPSEGRLLLFYDLWELPLEFAPESSVGWGLLWDQSPVSSLARSAPPAAFASVPVNTRRMIFRSARIETSTVITPMPTDDMCWDAFSLDDADTRDCYEHWLTQFGTPDEIDSNNHQFSGFARSIQGGLQAASQLAANGINCGGRDAYKTPAAKKLLEDAKDWRLVLQIGVDKTAGINVDDSTGVAGGAYYVVMREQDIAARRFDRAWVSFQTD